MSEEILKALMELFALIVKQDTGLFIEERAYVHDFLSKQLSRESVAEYLKLFDDLAGPVSIKVKDPEKESLAQHVTVRDSVKILGICKKINRNLNQEQKVVVILRLYELINVNKQFTPQRMNIINTVSEVFKIQPDEVNAIEQFVRNEEPEKLENNKILVLRTGDEKPKIHRKVLAGYHDTIIVFLRIPSVDLYFLKYISPDQLYLNGLPIESGKIYSFAKGSSIKSQFGQPVYYSDISAVFLSEEVVHRISFTVENLTYMFSDGGTAVNNLNFTLEGGNLVGILGSSGSGKTSLLNLMSGIMKPTSGKIKINGIDISENYKSIEGVLGYVPQDDLLIEDLTVFENLYYAACQCFGGKSKEEIRKITDQMLINLGLWEKRNLKVGSPLKNIISGGQRKRLNIALELIREPSVLFLDEPTSGLSSHDSENIMDLLRDLTLKGKLIITVIHQPSSEIFKLFDKIIILDQGGYMAYFGNPVEAVIYFKTLDAQINSSIGECPTCGNVNPEIIFNIIEAKVVDEYGRYTEQRKVKPQEWAAIFNEKRPILKIQEADEKPHSNLDRPSAFKQFLIYLVRDLKSKIANRQYILITLLEAPILGFILSFIIRYIPDPSSDVYIFFENENIPIYIFMGIIVAVFLGLTISAEEIFRDRKILKRERFLSLNRHSYLLSKIAILIIISSIQVFLFLIIANPILELRGLFGKYFIALFTTAFFANLIGLNISASFNSAITIYIVIPLIIIPMMVLSGAMFPFDKLNRKISSVGKVPVIAELMPTRWTYEALMVSQFKDNKYSRFSESKYGPTIYDFKKNISIANYYSVRLIPSLINALEKTDSIYVKTTSNTLNTGKLPLINDELKTSGKLALIKNELMKIQKKFPNLKSFNYINDLTPEKYNKNLYEKTLEHLRYLSDNFNRAGNKLSDSWDKFYIKNRDEIRRLENQYSNLKLQEIVTKFYERDKNKILEYKNSFIQNYDPIYKDPDYEGFLSFRTHFFAPSKYFMGKMYDTFDFNIMLVLCCSIILYVTLYYELLARLVNYIDRLKLKKVI
ncbi:MAG TPA: ATP-binding cassette domain-containing protein [Bacteroidales bacterium]|nr:ATP-binding cassette domain-containing protein [Bacteroidales bacterium]HOK73919.1 ATP-binding cassette domain-containing protein [Bacteroidales bacterium]HOM39570.1 ATP-binding cassette domain-containing protein [Bacteroidales bacterium]HPP91952.1 ATP-binding cassette domain-containing protein [Bacteroidales bacterium]HRR15627.1 ATP-binding cassette domain-containing protein [Bacteroidales bacterium]